MLASSARADVGIFPIGTLPERSDAVTAPVNDQDVVLRLGDRQPVALQLETRGSNRPGQVPRQSRRRQHRAGRREHHPSVAPHDRLGDDGDVPYTQLSTDSYKTACQTRGRNYQSVSDLRCREPHRERPDGQEPSSSECGLQHRSYAGDTIDGASGTYCRHQPATAKSSQCEYRWNRFVGTMVREFSPARPA